MLVVRNVLVGLATILLAVFGDIVINSWPSHREKQSVRLICEVHVVHVGKQVRSRTCSGRVVELRPVVMSFGRIRFIDPLDRECETSISQSTCTSSFTKIYLDFLILILKKIDTF
jgi:hypothetical protein